MLQSFRPQDFIHLPPLGEAGTLTLVEELAAVAHDEPSLPAVVRTALAHLLGVADELKKHIAARERAGSRADPRARAADRALDDAWGAMQTWLLGWTRLPDDAHPRAADARALYASLFPKGLQFLMLDFKDEWTESQNRIDEIMRFKQDEVLDALGGRAFLDTVVRAHRAYGEALHIIGASGGGARPEPDMLVRRSLEATHMALREYVAQVAATVRRSEPGSMGLAELLLAPLSARAAGTSAEGDPERDPNDVTLASAR